MTLMPPTVVRPREIVQILRKHLWLWMTPVVVCTLGAGIYGLMRKPTWRAAQTLYVRDEAIGKLGPPGRFENVDAMKAAQETIQEAARNHAVVKASLQQAGPQNGATPSNAWPTLDDVQQLRKVIRVTAPKGTEFGRSEVIYLSVDGPSQERAARLTRAVCDQLDERLKTLRNRRARSVVRELEQTLELARADLAESTRRLERVESEVGSDLGELRILNDTGAGDSNLRRALNEIKNELRQARTRQAMLEQQQKLLLAARQDPGELIATPNQLLESQPALRRLKDGLVDAQLRTADLSGRMSNDHPLVKAAVESERRVRNDLHAEVEVALRGVNADQEVNRALVASLEKQVTDVEQRLDRLAQLRARYSNLVADVEQRGQILDDAQRELAEARADEGAAQSASLLTRIDEPVVDDDPLGPGLGLMLALGFGGGLMIGLGAVFLTVPIVRLRGRRWSDYFPGSRAGDAAGGRRAGEQGSPGAREATAGRGGMARRAGDSPPVVEPATESRRASDPPPPAAGDRRTGDRRKGDRRSAAREEAAGPPPTSVDESPPLP
jgi:succinoglycan biosynthesis transport protein ExoP